ncbi:MAG: hypothetical protein ACWGHV_12810 [Stutzerimonas stutzeri]
MAINKDRIVKLINNRAVPGQPAAAAGRCPAMTRHLPGYAYDVDDAKKLLGEAGHRRRLRDRTVRHEHRSQPAHRPGDPAGSGGDRHQGARSSRWPRPMSLPPAAKRAARR